MGTNRYVHYAACSCCGRFDTLHICKNYTMFRGYPADPDWPQDPSPTPFGPLIAWSDWKRVLLSDGVTLWNEYGDQEDIGEFIATVEGTDTDARTRQYRAVVQHHYREGKTDAVIPGGEWLDPDDFSFYAGEFS